MNDRLLRYSLRGNALFSTGCGLAALALAQPLAEALGIPDPRTLTSLGAQLLVFAALLVWLAPRAGIRPAFALAVIAADVLWVVGTIPVVYAGGLTPAGNWTAIAIAEVVGLFAILQYLGLRRMRSPALASA